MRTTGAGLTSDGTRQPADEPAGKEASEEVGGGAVDGPARRTATDLAARVATELLAPWVVVALLPHAVAWRATHSLGATLLWGMLVALTSSVIPMGVIVWGARTGRWEGHHVRNRTGRLVPFVTIITSSAVGVALLVVWHAPWPVVALDISMLALLVVTGAITAVWKISIHAAVAAGALAVLIVAYHPAMAALTPLVVAVSWSRVRLNDHTVAQVIVGALVGAAGGGGLYAALA